MASYNKKHKQSRPFSPTRAATKAERFLPGQMTW